MPTLYETLRADIITAVKARDSVTATALRTLDAGIQRASIDLNKPIDEQLANRPVKIKDDVLLVFFFYIFFKFQEIHGDVSN